MRALVLASLSVCAAALGVFACTGGSSSSGGGPPGEPDRASDASTAADGAQVDPIPSGPPLPAGTFLFTRHVASDKDHLIARGLATGTERVVTDLHGDGSEGWSIDGFSLSSDRTRIALSSLYGATQEDTLTLLATQRIWLTDTEGKLFRRLTPVFENRRPGTPGFRIDVREPAFAPDGKTVFYAYGEQVIGQSSGGTRTWAVPAESSGLPDLLDAPAACSVSSVVSVNPATGRVMLLQDICQDSADEGFVYFTADQQPVEVVLPFGALDPYYSPPRWGADGSLFLFGATQGGASGLYAYAVDTRQVLKIVDAGVDRVIENGAISPDGTAIVYCIREGTAENLHHVDLTQEPPVDTPLTTDGISCNPVF